MEDEDKESSKRTRKHQWAMKSLEMQGKQQNGEEGQKKMFSYSHIAVKGA